MGEKIGKKISRGSIIALTGELGSGKTTLIQGIGEGIGATSMIKSPSFTIIHEYPGPVPLYHFDLYRLKDEQEIIPLGYEEYFYKREGIVVVEWAEKIKNFLPPEHLKINIQMLNLSKRKISLEPHGSYYERIVSRIIGIED
ncbi:MAG: tRNA (adenosine(37)-N6)-threonylcarbamoyltransferase complex ATPase subunit type 1 TsaE [Candidatus Aerophobetes bacterium]|nr:tRNA (adenosine(37)-N6)-threonylcarbamoyltransferase complex ATPase subunit type 1 TsaE [Candidatus Aerophobetes bacterium]